VFQEGLAYIYGGPK